MVTCAVLVVASYSVPAMAMPGKGSSSLEFVTHPDAYE